MKWFLSYLELELLTDINMSESYIHTYMPTIHNNFTYFFQFIAIIFQKKIICTHTHIYIFKTSYNFIFNVTEEISAFLKFYNFFIVLKKDIINCHLSLLFCRHNNEIKSHIHTCSKRFTYVSVLYAKLKWVKVTFLLKKNK